MKYLAIDTSGGYLTVIANDGQKDYTVFVENCTTKHSLTLMPAVESVLTDSNMQLCDLDFIAAVVGPGSFTGIRIGVATVKALCYAAEKPALSVTSFDLLAYNDINKQKQLCLIDANHGNYYAMQYIGGSECGQPSFITIDKVKELSSQFSIVADKQIEGVDCTVADLCKGLKNAINAKCGCLIDANMGLVPLYVKRSQAEEEHPQ